MSTKHKHVTRRVMFDPMIEVVESVFDRDALARICEMHEDDFADAYGMDTWQVDQRAPSDHYYFLDRGASVLAVAHLDTVVRHEQRTARFLDTDGGAVVYSGALDDRLGAFIILDLLPKLGIEYDVLLTTGEEDGQSTAGFFDTEKDYDWIIEFDRGGTDVVLYQYEDDDMLDRVEASGARVGVGIFSDVSYMEHLGVKAINWGVGYRDYHSTRSHAYLDDTYMMVAQYVQFHHDNAGTAMPHRYVPPTSRGLWDHDDMDDWTAYRDRADDDSFAEYDAETKYLGDQRECDLIFGAHDHDDDDCADVLASL